MRGQPRRRKGIRAASKGRELQDRPVTIGGALDRHGGVGPGFDVLRIALALIILFGHIRWIATGVPSLGPAQPDAPGAPPLWNDWTFPRHEALVPMFFALSGFLVTASALRTHNVARFLSYRALRIVPALLTEVSLSALALGPLLTTWPLRDYFSDPNFFRYFGNVVGHIHFALPGLFLQNPAAGMVNVNLWTLPAEFYCYLSVAIIMAVALFYNRWLFSAVFILATAVLFLMNTACGLVLRQSPQPDNPYAAVIIYYFFAGCLFYFWREKIPLRPVLFWISVAMSYVLLLSTRAIFLAPLFLTYVTVYIGMVEFPRIPLLQTGDYSYGVYLYGFPIAQALVTVWPYFRGRPWELLAAAVVLTLAFAAASWHLIEKHCLKLKRKVPFGR